MRIVADENMPAVDLLLGDRAEVRRLAGRSITRADIADADALLVRSVTPVDARLLAGTRVRFVGTATAGTDHIDVAWLREAGIDFAAAPGANANSVVEYVLSAIAEVDDFLERLLSGGRVGIVGFGHVGRQLAMRLENLGIAYSAYDPWLAPASVSHGASLAEVMSAEVVCLHPALTDRSPWPSRHLLDSDQLARLGRSQLLINASRGEVVDNAALRARLDSAAAPQVVLDVWEDEPQILASLLARVRLGTPHVAGYSYDSKLLATQRLVAAMEQSQLLCRSTGTGTTVTHPMRVGLSAASSAAEALRLLLRSVYSVAEDDRQLRAATVDVAPAEAARRFDALRKAYPRRRELAGSTVRLGRAAANYASLASALGALYEIEER